MSFYPPEVHCRFLAPKFAGRTCTANAAGTGASFKCGCFVRFSMSIDPKIKKILEATYTTNGCGYMAAAADAIAEELSGKILTELGSAGHDGILNAIAAIVGPYPETRQHCASAAAEAVAAAFGDFRAFLIEEFSGEQALLCTCFGVSEKTIEEYVEEHAVEEGLLFDATDDDGKVTNKTATDRLKAAKAEGADRDEIKALVHVVGLFKAETAAKKAGKDARLNLDQLTLKQYTQLGTADVQSLVIDDKWGDRIAGGVNAERAALIQKLVERLNVLGERYEQTVGDLDAEVESLSEKVAAHLAAMGIA